jgi:beta-barrel assembly-enhancing protease
MTDLLTADRPVETTLAAALFDGDSARRHAVLVRHDATGLALSGDGIADDAIAWPVLVLIDTLPDAVVLGRTDRPGWRLKLPPDAPPEIVARLPRPGRFGAWIDRIGFLPSLALCLVVSGLIVASVLNAPGWLAPRLPTAWENGVSDDSIGDLSANTCHTPTSDAALAGLVAQLDHDALAHHLPPVHVEVIKIDLVNAVALPGGRVLVFDGLLQRIGSPDALAGVLGHEIGHVRLHHVMQALLRQYGLSLMLGSLRSSVTNAMGQLTALRYSRVTEDEADAWSRDRLSEAGVSPVPTGEFLASLAQYDPYSRSGTSDFLASHPDPLERGMMFRASFLETRQYRPALDDKAYAAIVKACDDDPKVKPWRPMPGPF